MWDSVLNFVVEVGTYGFWNTECVIVKLSQKICRSNDVKLSSAIRCQLNNPYNSIRIISNIWWNRFISSELILNKLTDGIYQ